MSPAEQVILIALLQSLRPKVAIEIGTLCGGFLSVLSHFTGKVYSIDIDPEVPKRLAGQFNNVEYLTGPCDRMLPPLLDKLRNQDLAFVLIDGDHTAAGVRRDIEMLLRYKPKVPLYILMHDSMNPDVRSGMRAAKCADNPHVHTVELDFVVGIMTPVKHLYGQAWEGLALAIMTPEVRTGPLVVTGRSEPLHRLAANSVRRDRSFLKRAVRKIKRLANRY